MAFGMRTQLALFMAAMKQKFLRNFGYKVLTAFHNVSVGHTVFIYYIFTLGSVSSNSLNVPRLLPPVGSLYIDVTKVMCSQSLMLLPYRNCTVVIGSSCLLPPFVH